MKEPYRSEFEKLIREGAGTLDIHNPTEETSYTLTIPAYEALVQREVDRVDIHMNSMIKLLEEYVGRAPRILDVGCGTGATTVAMGLSKVLDAEEVVGLDPNDFSLKAADVRARGYDLEPPRCRFEKIEVGEKLKYDDNSFDLTCCVSVIEYVHRLSDRYELARELQRVTKPGGHVLLITPNPFKVLDYHTKRLFGDWRRASGYPWSSPPWQLESMLHECDIIPLRGAQLRVGLSKRGVPAALAPDALGFFGYLLAWQKVLGRKRAS